MFSGGSLSPLHQTSSQQDSKTRTLLATAAGTLLTELPANWPGQSNLMLKCPARAWEQDLEEDLDFWFLPGPVPAVAAILRVTLQVEDPAVSLPL